MRVTPDNIAQFAEWSGDRNPLHVDPEFARQTHFGQPIAHGILTVLDAIASAGDIGRGRAVRSLDIEFRTAVAPGADYSVETSETSSGFDITVRGDDSAALGIGARTGAPVPGDPGVDVSWLQAAMSRDDCFTLRSQPAHRTLEQLCHGITVTGAYPFTSGDSWNSASPLSTTQMRVLGLCSYITGMEIPGLRSLFTRVRVEFYGSAATVEPLWYRARTVRCDEQFRLLETELQVVTSSGGPVATVQLRSYVPFSPTAIDLDELARRSVPSTAKLRDTIALVIGGSRGLGADMAAAIALAGAHVYATARHPDRAADQLQRDLAARHCHLELLYGDAGDAGWCQSALATLLAAHGRVDLLVLNACAPPSHVRVGRSASGRDDHYVRDNLALVESPLATFVEALDASRGALVYVSSSFVEDCPAGFARYVAVKQAGEAIVRTAAREYPGLSALIARPPVLQTRWNDTPAGVAGAIRSDRVASRIVNRLAETWGAGEVALIAEFPAFASAEPAGSPPEPHEPAFTIRVAASFTTDALVPPLDFWLKELGIDGRVETAPYGQVLQSLLDPASLFAARTKGVNIVFLRVRDWLRELTDRDAGSLDFIRTYLHQTASEFERALKTHRGRASSDTLLVICPSYGGSSSAENIILRQVEADLAAALGNVPGLTIAAASDYHAHFAVDEDDVSDPLRDEIGHIPYKDSYLRVLSAIAARHAHRQMAPPKKVVVVDCDNTLWRGVVGEVGADGIAFDNSHRALHELLVRLSANGVLVCLCSKNEEADVWRVFDTRDDFVLRREHITAATINWLPKSQNTRALAARLNLGVDSFMFLDDNPVEVAELRASCPEMLTLEWPQHPARAISLLRHTWELDVRPGTSEDQRRTEMYREELRRQELHSETLTLGDFIDSLQLVVDLAPLSAEYLRRSAQLTLRTNQFNFTTKRRDESDLQALVNGGRHDITTVHVRDRFGDYGLVGLVVVERRGEVWELDTFLLSCRVLGRGVEHRILSELGRTAAAAGVRSVRMRLEFTKRNTPARMFVESVVPAELRKQIEGALECDLSPEVLAAVKFEPAAYAESSAGLAADDVTPAPQVTDFAAVRRREEQIARTAFQLSTVSGLHVAIEGRGTTTATPSPASGDVADIVHGAFATVLGVPVDAVKETDRLEALGCNSLRIVEITVALRERFPSLPSTLLFEHQSVAKIVRAIQELSNANVASDARKAAPDVSPASTVSHDVAVVGMHVRCAGANSPAELWDLLSAGRSAVRAVPADRPHFLRRLDDTRPHWAGLLDDPARFDAEFFGVSPREAAYMDPQLRLFLEVAWGAIEDAGAAGAEHDPHTGVFVGVMYGDYALRANHGQTDGAYRCWEGFSLANRLSQLLDFHGPSLAVDTACSSSGTALHLACRALNAGDCPVAVVGGVNLILDPDRFASLGRLGILSATGQCEPFGAAADGTVLGEGAGAVVLRPLDEAIRRGDRIYGVIKGTGLSTGTGTVGFTAPNPQAQADAISRTIDAAGVDPRTITYVETHGTGTALGDPIEVRGLTLALTRSSLYDPGLAIDHRCRIGSIKPNIGHLEAGAGILGLVKVLLQLHHRTLVPSMTSDEPNPQIPFSETPFSVQRSLEPWHPLTVATGGRSLTLPRRAGLSSFGVGGANAHVIVEEAPVVERQHERRAVDRPVHLLAFSARTGEALGRRAAGIRELLAERPEMAPADLAYTLNVGHTHFHHRVAIAASGRDELIAKLDAVGQGGDARGVVRGRISSSTPSPKTAFLFTGQGSQYPGMGRQLYETQPVFRAALDRCAGIFESMIGRALLPLMFAERGTADAELLNQTGFTQPALFAFEHALTELWRSWGIHPDFVLGHSVGEVGAMWAAGGISLEDGLTLIAARGRLMQALPPGGTMTSVLADEELVLEAIAGAHDVSIAAVNAPRQVVISGSGSAVAEIAARLAAGGIKTKALTVSHAFHSPLMKPMLAEYEHVVRTIAFTPPRIPLVSCVDGALVTHEITDPEYWLRQVMDPVRFAVGVRALEAEGVSAYLEIGPQPVLLGMGRQCLDDERGTVEWLPSLRPDADPWPTLMASLSTLYVKGAPVDWKAFDAPYARQRISVPAYPFSQKPYWLRSTESDSDDHGGRPALALPVANTQRGLQLYELQWRSQPSLPDATERAGSLTWVIFADGGGVGRDLARLLVERGARPIVVTAGERYREIDARTYEIDTTKASDYTQLWSAVAPAGTDVRVLHFWGLDAPRLGASDAGVDADINRPVETLLHVTRAINETDGRVCRLWCVTRGSVDAGPGDTASLSVAQAPLWGFGRTAALEHPDTWGGLIDLPPGDCTADLVPLLNEILSGDQEDQIALRESRRYAARLAIRQGANESNLTLHADAAYLITGGLGALGLTVARWLIDRGARRIVLTSRRGAGDARAQSEVRALEQRGARVTVIAADVARAEDVDALMAAIRDGGVPLRGIVHAAGVDVQTSILQLTPADVRAVMAPKVQGGWLLHEHTKALALDFFVLFSSVASVLGSNGRAHYGAANAFLDALAMERRHLGLPALAVNWGPWRGGGMASVGQLSEYERFGNHGIDPDAALSAFNILAASNDVQVAALDIDWATFKPIYEARRPRPILKDVATPTVPAGTQPLPQQPSDTAPSGSGHWVARLQAFPAGERRDALAALVQREVANTLGFDDCASVAVADNFYDIGMDSLMMADLVGRLNKAFGISSSRLVFDHPTVESLSAVLLERLAVPEVAHVADVPATAATIPDSGTIGYQAKLEDEVFAFQTRAWPHRDPGLIPPRWRWMFVESARRLGRDPIIWLHRDNGAIVGHMGAIPVTLKVGAEVHETAWCVDTMVLESHRSRAVGARLMVDAQQTLPFGLSLGQTSEMRQICFRLGWKQIAQLQVAQCLIRPENVLKGKLPGPAAWAAGLGLRATAAARELLRDRMLMRVREVARFDERHNRLWRESSADMQCAVVRDASYLNWKYVDQPGQDFLRLELLEGDSVRGVAVWMFREPDSAYRYRRAYLVDLVAPLHDEARLQAVVRSACTVPADRGADALICMHISPKLTRTLRQCGFLLRSPERFLLVDPGPLAGTSLEQVLSADAWYVTQGDADIDRPW